jgi:hypothetical protein
LFGFLKQRNLPLRPKIGIIVLEMLQDNEPYGYEIHKAPATKSEVRVQRAYCGAVVEDDVELAIAIPVVALHDKK